MKSQQTVFPEHSAYREAGHTVMSYLILKGFTDQYIPISRQDILSEFHQVTIEVESTHWAKTTFALGSFITVPQVLLAGDLSEAIKFNRPTDLTSRKLKLVNEARDILRGYVAEYYTDDVSANRKETEKLFGQLRSHVEENLLRHWTSIESLATALLEQKTISTEKAFELIERHIPDDLKLKAQIELGRTTNEKLRGILQNTKRQESKANATPSRKFWWEFWKK